VQPAAQYDDEEPGLLQRMDDDEFFAHDAPTRRFDSPSLPELGDDLPEPVYRADVHPLTAQDEPDQNASFDSDDSDLSGFVAPKPRGTGKPSREAMDRLAAAVSKTQKNRAEPQAPATQTPPADRQPRFGINSLINRMTGHAQDSAPHEDQARIQPQVNQAPEQEPDPEQERIDIPAFLRRQAN